MLATKRKRRVWGSKSDTPRHREGGAHDPDLISDLLDDVLSYIVSLLLVKDFARTSIFSTRWHHLLTTASLNLDNSILCHSSRLTESWMRSQKEAWHAGAIDQILSVHRGPIPTCHLSDYFFNLPNIYLWLGWNCLGGPIPSILANSSSLLHLGLLSCRHRRPPWPCHRRTPSFPPFVLQYVLKTNKVFLHVPKFGQNGFSLIYPLENVQQPWCC